MVKKLYYLGKPADGFGWGICNTNLVRELSKLCDVEVPDDKRNRFDAPVFTPVAGHDLNPGRPVKCPRLIGYGFWEWPLAQPAAKFNSERYYHLFAGSTWCANRVRQQTGHPRVTALIQGVDFERFKPTPYPADRKGFRIFSGGKYEFRKGQDIVLAAMKIFLDIRKDAVLLCAWHNPWPATCQSMSQSWLINAAKPFDGIPEKQVVKLPPGENRLMPLVYEQCDVGLFTNRCEAGTNLVLMEFMASGRAVIATDATGHKDVLTGPGPLRLTQGSIDEAGWFNCDVSDVLTQLEHAYTHRAELPDRGEQCRAAVEAWTWEKAAKEIVRVAFE